ncbi:testis-expressed protein 36 isoform X3 [Anolis carolinensis]|uniref:testis-expressed protein 36 isoform X3 n=1 Tax=Anolis carolinensis TaxID=28377 RepID=UPI0002038D81
MPKGKRANPSTALDGIWFAHHGNLPLYPETLTAAMQKQILNPEATHQIDTRLPLMYKVREKKPGSTFPFSIHDNRHCLINVGEYLDSGRKKQPVCYRIRISTALANSFIPKQIPN